MAVEEAGAVLGDIGGGASAEDGDFLLDFLDIVVARFKIDLGEGVRESPRQ